MSTSTLTLYPIAIDAQRTRCRRCGRKLYIITTAKGHRKAVDCEADGTRRPSNTQPGDGTEHSKDCAPSSH